MLNPPVAEPRHPRRPRLVGLLLVLAAVLFAGLCALGWWQVERRASKLDLIERVEARVHAEPVAAPGPADWSQVSAARDEYRPVELSGRYLNDREALVQAVTERGGGFWVLTPFRADDGFNVLVNRGYVPAEKRDPASRPAGQINEPTRVVGLLRMSEPGGGFLRSNDPAADRWYSRDVDAIAKARQLEGVAPYFVDAEAVSDPEAPVGGLTVLRFSNNHLVYAVTWFGLALMVLLAAFLLIRDEWRLRGGKAAQ
jgi:surfeit locus 1 family protein